MLADLVGKPPISGVATMRTVRDPHALVAALAPRVRSLLSDHPAVEVCEGLGVVVPGMVEHSTMRVLHAPALGWRDVDLREPLSTATGLPVQVENSGRACMLAQAWAACGDLGGAEANSVFVSVSDGLGIGVMVQGELLRGRHNIAGVSSAICLSRSTVRRARVARMAVGRRTSPTAHCSRAILAAAPQTVRRRWLKVGSSPSKISWRAPAPTMRRRLPPSRRLAVTWGWVSASVINALDPSLVYIGGEITLACGPGGGTSAGSARRTQWRPGGGANRDSRGGSR